MTFGARAMPAGGERGRTATRPTMSTMERKSRAVRELQLVAEIPCMLQGGGEVGGSSCTSVMVCARW